MAQNVTAESMSIMKAQSNPNGFVINSEGVLEKYTGSDTKVIIPDGVTSIGEKAFFGCESLANVHLPDSVTKIGEDAFFLCNDALKCCISSELYFQ